MLREQEGQAVPRAVRGQEEEPPGEVHPQAIVRRREVHRTMGAAAMGGAVTAEEETTAGRIL